MRGTNLQTLRSELKAEIGQSQTQGTFNDATLNVLLSNRQRWLASEYDWPFLEQRYDVTIPAPRSRYLTFPLVNTDRPFKGEVFWNNAYQPTEYGVDSIEYNYLNSDQNQTQDPVQRFRFADQIEVFAPSTSPAAAAGSGGNVNGTVKYLVTFITAYGETTAGPSVSVTVATQQVTVSSLPIGPTITIETVSGLPSIITGRNIYRTKQAGSTFFLLTTINDNVTTIYNDNTADTFLPTTTPPTSSSAEVTMFEIWPMNQTVQTMRFTGQRALSPLVLDTDTADLDDLLIVWSAALQPQLRNKLADAQYTATQLQQRMAKLRSDLPSRDMKCKVAGDAMKKDAGRLQRVVPIVAVHG